jgi:hypothetical protein
MSHTGGRVTALPLQALRKSSRLLIELFVTNVFANELMKEAAIGGTSRTTYQVDPFDSNEHCRLQAG